MRHYRYVLFVICLLFLPGCWSQIEINNRAFVTGIFIDQAPMPDEVRVTIITPLPNRLTSAQSGGGGGQPTGKTYGAVSKNGKTIAEALQKIQADLSRRLTWGHTRIIVLGKAYAKKGVSPLFEWLNRQPSILLKTAILVAPHQAEKILNLTTVYERSPVDVLLAFAERHAALSASVREVVQGIITNQGSAITALTYGEVPMVSEDGKVKPWAGTDGGALFQRDKLVGQVTTKEAMMLAWMKKTLKDPTFTIQLQPENDRISLGFEETKSYIRPRLKGNRVHYEIHLSGNAHILSADTKQDVSDPKTIRKVEKQMATELNKHLKKALLKTQKAQADVMQLGCRLEWWYPKKWADVYNQWKTYYRDQVVFDTHIEIHIQHFGAVAEPFHIK